jgi:hypothetical protein
MANTFTLIQAKTLSSAQSNIEFTSIPATFTDLVLKVSARTAVTADAFDSIQVQFNGDTASNYSWIRLRGSGSASADSGGSTSSTYVMMQYINGDAATANTFGSSEMYIPNYAGSTQKSCSVESVNETNATTAYMCLIAGRWTGTAAITSIKLTTISTDNFKINSTAYLYGVKNA